MNPNQRYPSVLAVYPNTRGFAFVLFESSLSPIDWGVKETRGPRKNARCLEKITVIVGRYLPNVLVIQNTSLQGTPRAGRIRKLNEAVAKLAEKLQIPFRAYSRADVLEAFGPFGVRNKHEIAEVIAKHIPAFQRYVPPPRKPWMSEDARMGLFDAAALALTFFKAQGGLG
jgi:hypothetical protein